MNNNSIFSIYSVWLTVPFWDNFITVVSIFLAKFREWTKQLRRCQDSVIIYIFRFCHRKTSNRFFQNSRTHQNVNVMFCRTIYIIWIPTLQVFIHRYLYCKIKLGYPYHLESVSQIEKQLWHKLGNKLSLNPVSISILQVQKQRSRISKPTFITLASAKCVLMVSLIRCQ